MAGASSWATGAQPLAPSDADSHAGSDAGSEPDEPTQAAGRSPAAAILRQLCDGSLPWDQQQDGDSTLPLIRRRMGLTAFKVRAAVREQDLVIYEFDNLLRSYNSRLQALRAAVHGKQRQIADLRQQQDIHRSADPEGTLTPQQQQQLQSLQEHQRLPAGQLCLLQRM